MMNRCINFNHCVNPFFDFIIVALGYGVLKVDVLRRFHLIMDVSNNKFFELHVVERWRRNICQEFNKPRFETDL